MTKPWRLSPLLAFVLLLASSDARAQAPDWNEVAVKDTIEILTHDADGDLRETTVWIGVVDGIGYVRTSDSRWRENIERDSELVLRVGDREYPLRGEFVTDVALRARVNSIFRAKYGFTDRMLGWFGNEGGKFQIALRPRPENP